VRRDGIAKVKEFQMHNCRQTRKQLIHLAFAERQVGSTQLLRELNSCPECREEFETFRSTLHVSAQALRSTLPGEDFWPSYNERLRTKLTNATPVLEKQPRPLPPGARLRSAFREFVTSSVRLPIPAALAALLLIGVSLAGLLKAAGSNVRPEVKPVVVTKTVEVPVIQEKIVTRVVYVEKKNGRSSREIDLASGVAKVESTRKPALSLVGFKPTDQVRLTIIKGSYQDEK
jgi:hypothetical protein